MPDRLIVNGRCYVAEDAIATPVRPEQEPWLPLKALCREYGIEPHKAYRAVRDGALDARLPAGQTRGLRCRRSEFVRWMEECLLVRA